MKLDKTGNAEDRIDNQGYRGRAVLGYLSPGHYLFRKANSFPRATLSVNCLLLGTDNVGGQISEHIFAPNEDNRVYYPSYLLRNAPVLKIGGYCQISPSFRSRDVFESILSKTAVPKVPSKPKDLRNRLGYPGLAVLSTQQQRCLNQERLVCTNARRLVLPLSY